MALQQTNGKGQRGKQWQTGKNENLALSIVLNSNTITLLQQFLLQTFVCVGLVNYLNTLKTGFCIKWPNDIYYNDRKAAGILIENIVSGSTWRFAIVGIGLNVNQVAFANELTNAISLQQITGNSFDLYTVAVSICNSLQQNWENFLQLPLAFLQRYNNNLYKKGQFVKVKHQNEILEILVKNVNEQGLLICGKKAEVSFTYGSIDWIN